MPDFLRLEPAPTRDRVIEDKDEMNLSQSFSRWFGKAHNFWNAIAPSTDYIGNADATLYPGKSSVTQICITPLMANRAWTLSTEKAWIGARYLCVRTSASTGNFTINVGGLKTLSAGEWCEVEFDGSAWVLTRSGIVANSSSLTTPWYWRGSDGTILVEIETDGTLVFHDSATTWNDINLSLIPPATGAAAPSVIAINGDARLKCYAFAGGGAVPDEISGSCEILHDYKEESNITPHIHWCPVDANAGDVKFQLRYMWVERNGTFSGGQTISVVLPAPGVAWQEVRSSFPVISGTGHHIGSRFIYNLFRDQTDVQDTYGSNVGVFDFGIHFERDTLGSRGITAK